MIIRVLTSDRKIFTVYDDFNHEDSEDRFRELVELHFADEIVQLFDENTDEVTMEEYGEI